MAECLALALSPRLPRDRLLGLADLERAEADVSDVAEKDAPAREGPVD